MAKYVDGFVIVVPKDKAQMYIDMASGGRDSWMKHGALNYFECRGNDLIQHEMGDMKSRAFTEMAGAGPNDDVWFSFITFESRAHRDEVNKKVMDEMNEQMKGHENDPMPFSMTQMAYGGFQVEVEG
jgi:uncharacterized protein YbaA (DUF1428 family)